MATHDDGSPDAPHPGSPHPHPEGRAGPPSHTPGVNPDPCSLADLRAVYERLVAEQYPLGRSLDSAIADARARLAALTSARACVAAATTAREGVRVWYEGLSDDVELGSARAAVAEAAHSEAVLVVSRLCVLGAPR